MSIFKKIYELLIPVLFAIYSALALFSFNVEVVKFADLSWILIFSILLGAVVTGLLFVIFRNRSKASLIATCWLIIFFSYGQVYNVIHKSMGASIGRNAILIPMAFILMALSVVWIWKLARDLSWITTFFGWMIAVLLIITGFSLGRYFISVYVNKTVKPPQAAVSTAANPSTGPDIYYIILDAHGRQDILQDLYKYDSSPFIQFLKNKGFFVADSSHSNYAQTVLSLSSSLNMQYLDNIGVPDSSVEAGRTWLDGKIWHSQVREILAKQGYKLVSFSNGTPTAPEDANIFYAYGATPNAANGNKAFGASGFVQMFLSSTMARVVVDQGWFSGITTNQQQYEFHYLQTKYIFDKLTEVPKLPGKYFIFAHIIAPHPPFVFSSNGSFTYNPFSEYTLADGSNYPGTTQEYLAGYEDQVEYVDKVMEKVITGILANSNTAPIIIIQGDHGPGAYLDWNSAEKTNLAERMSILNAYYFPGDHASALYPSITPVNSFRVLLNEYFGLAYPRLDDRSYFSTWDHPFDYIDVTSKLTGHSPK